MFSREEINTYEVEWEHVKGNKRIRSVDAVDAWNIWDAASKVAQLHSGLDFFHVLEIAKNCGGNEWEIVYDSQESILPYRMRDFEIVYSGIVNI